MKYFEPRRLVFPDYESIPFTYYPDYPYRYNYLHLHQKVTDPKTSKEQRRAWYKEIILHDYFWIIYFHLRIKKANHPWVIGRCNEIQKENDLAKDFDVLDEWAREHFKSTILSTAKPIQKILRNAEERICIFSFKQSAARDIYDPIKELFEKDQLLIKLFPDILCTDVRDYPRWTRDLGFTVKRKGFYREPTLMWSALSEGMPTGKHFSGKIYDDIMTLDMAKSKEEMELSKVAFDMSQNLRDSDMGSDDVEWQVIAGTPYHYNDTLKHIKEIKNIDGTPAYRVRSYPATDNGRHDGKPVLLTQASLDRLKRDKKSFSSQQLLKPLQAGDRKLNFDMLIKVSKEQLPKNLWKFMLVDPAGTLDTQSQKHKGDRWAIALIGVEPNVDDNGASSLYLLDMKIRRYTFKECIEAILSMYVLGGRIVKLGVEKVATSTYEIHIANALKKFGRYLNVKSGSLVLLRPGHRNKHERIESALSWPIDNGKCHYLDTIEEADLKELRSEMEEFPLGRDDGLDIISYIYDMIKDYKFPKHESSVGNSRGNPNNDLWRDEDDPRAVEPGVRRWMVA